MSAPVICPSKVPSPPIRTMKIMYAVHCTPKIEFGRRGGHRRSTANVSSQAPTTVRPKLRAACA